MACPLRFRTEDLWLWWARQWKNDCEEKRKSISTDAFPVAAHLITHNCCGNSNYCMEQRALCARALASGRNWFSPNGRKKKSSLLLKVMGNIFFSADFNVHFLLLRIWSRESFFHFVVGPHSMGFSASEGYKSHICPKLWFDDLSFAAITPHSVFLIIHIVLDFIGRKFF